MRVSNTPRNCYDQCSKLQLTLRLTMDWQGVYLKDLLPEQRQHAHRDISSW